MNPFLLAYFIGAAIWLVVMLVSNYESLQTEPADRIVVGTTVCTALWPIHLLLFLTSVVAWIINRWCKT